MIIHIAYPSGEKREFEETLLRHEWEQGNIPQAAMYWKDGMQDWQPVASLLSPYAPPQVSPIPAPPTGGGRFQYTVDPRKLTKTLMVMLWISLALDVILQISNGMQYALLSGAPYTVAEGESNDLRQTIIVAAGFIWFVVTGITFLKWIRRANINCRGFGAGGMEFTPGWSIGWYFVPIASLFKPYQSMREIWRISNDPVNWPAVPSGALLKVWWTMWIFNNIAGQISTRMNSSATEMNELITSTAAAMFCNFLSMALTIVAVSLVKRIAAKQEELVGGEVL